MYTMFKVTSKSQRRDQVAERTKGDMPQRDKEENQQLPLAMVRGTVKLVKPKPKH